jgi:hypothetical protein
MSETSGAPTPTEIGGVKFFSHPMRDIDHDILNNYVQREYIVKQVDIAMSLSPTVQQIAVAVAQQTAMKLRYQKGLGIDMFCTYGGMALCLHILSRKVLPLSQCETLVDSEERVQEVIDLWKDACLVKNSLPLKEQGQA